MRYDLDIACTSYLTLHEQKLRIKSFLIEYFGTVHFSIVETGSSITAVQEETVFFEWVHAGRPDRTTKELFLFEWTEQERWSGHFLLKCSFFNRLEDNSRQKQFEKIVLQIKEHMEHPTLTLDITQKDNLIDVRQFHRRGDGNIGYGLWIYRKDFHLLYEGIKEVYPLKVKGFENFDHTGMNFISKSEWKVILNHWSILAISNPSSAEFIDYVGRWVVATLKRVDEIAIEGNL
ncbi:hypothetical protein [Paenibacillus chitinolyticus]|uniref:hypothetical protein n=1 Tax=Paenibacillus chitinolyticus TaxID=79263 RepID=UPI003670A605